MRTPINTELQHLAPGYDPAKAHDYYEKHKHLKGRQKGSAESPLATIGKRAKRLAATSPKAKQKIALQNSIQNLEAKLGKLEQLIREKEAILKRDQAQAKVKVRKPKDKPQTAADKAKATRENKKYRDKHKQQLKTKAKQATGKSGGGSGGGSSKSSAKSQKPSDMSIANLKALATKVKGQIAVAKQKLAAL